MTGNRHPIAELYRWIAEGHKLTNASLAEAGVPEELWETVWLDAQWLLDIHATGNRQAAWDEGATRARALIEQVPDAGGADRGESPRALAARVGRGVADRTSNYVAPPVRKLSDDPRKLAALVPLDDQARAGSGR